MTWFLLALHVVLITSFGLRILLRNDLRPDVRMGWLTVIVLLPYASCILYYLFGEVVLRRHGGKPHQRVQDFAAALLQHANLLQALPSSGKDISHSAAQGTAAHQICGQPSNLSTHIAPAWQAAFGYAASINGFYPLPGHAAQLMADGAQARSQMIADMDAAQHEINVLYYIWLDDTTGAAVAQALIRASRRGVACRAIVDGLGSRHLLQSALWRQMDLAGVQCAVALSIHRPIRVMLNSRLDLRNHRKITVIDGRIAYCGSQNCADEAFLPKARYGPWVDIMLRLHGPVVAQMQLVFANDWQQYADQPYTPLLSGAEPACPTPASGTEHVEPPPNHRFLEGSSTPTGFAALTIAEGPSERARSSPQLFATLISSAQQELVISTPYFIPDATVLDALTAAAWRGVRVTLIVPARNDSLIVGAASRSNYHRLLNAGIALYEFTPGLLHSKTLCVDGQVSLIGSTNLDLRSFDLNFENNVLLQDSALTLAIRARQDHYIAQSQRITLEHIHQWRWSRRIWNNLLATLSPVL